ncbi:MAG TPA: T9SS type A sorting domain-containing protein [Flavipsychrobacter sp.]|nr:T9SS type A sorting domain-containing protein [Flavipsychrobacter sp.]
MLKTDSSGNLIWSKTIGGNGDETATGSIFEAAGGYYIASGSTSRDNDCIDTSWCPNTYMDYDSYLFFLDTAGTIQWAKSYGGSGGDVMHNAFLDARDSTIVMVGTTTSTDFMVSQTYSQIVSIWVVKTDKNGNLIWANRLGDTAADNYWPNIIPTTDGYVVSCAYGDANQIYNIGNLDALFYLTDTSGLVLSDKILGGIRGDVPRAVFQFQNGFRAIGRSASYDFSDGTNENNNHSSQQWDVFVSDLHRDTILRATMLQQGAVIKLYPNPARDEVRVILPDTRPAGEIIIADSGGKVTYRQRVRRKSEVSINVSGWAKGLYFVEWRGKDSDHYSTQLSIQ